MFSLQPISNVIGVLLLVIGMSMMACIPASAYFESGDGTSLFISGAITMIIGILSWKLRFIGSATKLNKREGYLIVALSWFFMSIFSCLPYLVSGVVTDPADAIFESVSGLTTTGATIFSDIEFLPKGILLWRSLTQWIGGMGIIVLTVALFPLLGIGGIELFVAEAPGPTTDKLHPRIKETAKRLWWLYVSITALLCILLWAEGLTFFDALNHSFTTMATGGFSTKNSSIAYYTSPLIQYTLICFMFIAGMNYFVIYNLMKKRFTKVWTNEEFRLYLFFTLGVALAISFAIFYNTDQSYEKSFRDALFQVVSLITTTGYITADYTSYNNGLTAAFFFLLFVGASAGSTAGGVKLIRHLVFLKNSLLEFKRILHPRAMIRIKINKEIVPPRILTHILVFLLLYLFCFVGSTLFLTFLDMDLISAAGASATCLDNAGPGIGSVGPINNFANVPKLGKYFLSFIMVVGRLEIFTILILFTPFFWKTN